MYESVHEVTKSNIWIEEVLMYAIMKITACLICIETFIWDVD